MRIPFLHNFILLVLTVFLTGAFYSQKENNFRTKVLNLKDTILKLDTLSILPSSFRVYESTKLINDSLYEIDFFDGNFIWKGQIPILLHFEYRVFALDFTKKYQNRDTSLIRSEDTLKMVPFRFTTANNNSDWLGGSGLNKSGSISRGVMFGNNQDLSVNSNLNLQLSGKISDEISILASISDDNIPIQPEGNTQQLQDFDQVYIQLFTDKWKLTAGDFWMKNPRSYFMKYNKRAQGGSLQIKEENIFSNIDSSALKFTASAAVSKGKFGRNVIQGIENNQGPYKLIGADGEQFIIVLSGTEMVYIDGEMVVRGQENDYIIDYNTAEIIFTANRLITKDKRITVEFQYSDKNFARSIIEVNAETTIKDWDVFVNVYSEQDAKNQPLQQELDDFDKETLFNAGDNLLLAQTSGIDSLGFDNNSNRYEKLDSLGYEIVRFTTNETTGLYAVVFSDVGIGNGDYIQSEFSAFGKIYEWIAPDTIGGLIIHNGRFEPVKLLIAPKKRQMLSGGFNRRIGKGITTSMELAYSNNDVNTFSDLDAADNEGYAAKFSFLVNKKLNKKWTLKSVNNLELTSENFMMIERFRDVEFNRNWNVNNLENGNQLIGNASVNLTNSNVFSILYGLNYFKQDEVYNGIKNNLTLDVRKFLDVKYVGSYLGSTSDENTNFYRHKSNVSKSKGIFRIGYEDEFERNVFTKNDSISNASYQFYDYQFYVSNSDSTVNKFKIFYRERQDNFFDGENLLLATRAINPGGELQLLKNPKQQFVLKTNYRKLITQDTNSVSNASENGLLNRVEYRANFLGGGITSTMFYEVGSGLELRREYAYIEVPAGQGVYTWVDYNGDNVKDLNEFELAQYPDQATYLRVSTPSNNYVKVLSNEFSEVLGINFKNIFKGKDIFSKFIQRFNSQTNYKVERKTTQEDILESLNPFGAIPDDENLVSVNNSIRQSTFFNRTNSKFGLEHTYLSFSSKSLLVSGFDTRTRESNEVKLRLNLTRKFTIQLSGEIENKVSKADYILGRDYDIDILKTEGKFTFQPSTAYRIAFVGGYKDKRNDPSIVESDAFITEMGLEGKWNQLKKGTLTGNFKYAKIVYTGVGNNALAFEMLESLQPGDNIIWTLGYQRTFANNLQLTINYNGRKSDGTDMVHTGGLQLRAFF